MQFNNDDFPFVSALLVTRNEIDYIEDSLISLINQTYPKDKYEIIVIDGMSDDGTRDLIQSIIDKYSTDKFSITMLENPKRILASGWNLGIKNAKGDFVVRIDAHAVAPENFIRKNVETILSVEAVCVGGKLITKSLDEKGKTISKVLSSPFGVGNSSFRVSDTPAYTDTAVYGLYRKEIFDKVGYFDESFIRNQDIELHSRIKRSGGKFYFNPKIESIYFARNTIKKMIRQAFGNGKWNMILLKKKKSALSIRHLIPFAFVLYILLSLIGGFVCKFIWILAIAVLLLHLTLGFISALKKDANLKELYVMPILFLMLHFAYGCGFFSGLLTNINKI